jgi:hypothetical protein
MKSSERPGRVTYRLCRSYQAVQLSVERKISLMNYFYPSTLSRAALAHCYGQVLWADIHWAVVFLLSILSFIVLFCLHTFFYIFNCFLFLSFIYLFIYSSCRTFFLLASEINIRDYNWFANSPPPHGAIAPSGPGLPQTHHTR